MRIMDFMSFDLSWFKSLPGILLILGCFCLIIAIILIPTLTRKKDEFEVDLDPKEGEELLNRPEDLGMLSTNQSIPVNTPMQEEIKQEIPAAPSPIMEEIKVDQPVVNTTPIEVEKPQVVEEVVMSEPLVEAPIMQEPLIEEKVELNNKNTNNPVVMPSTLNVDQNISPLEVKEEQKVEVVLAPETIPMVTNNNVNLTNVNDMIKTEVIPSVIENVEPIKEKISVKNDSFGGEKLLPDDFKIEINERKEAFGGEKLLPDDFKPELEKPHLSNTQSFSLRDIAIQKEQPVESVLPVQHVQPVVNQTMPLTEDVKQPSLPVIENVPVREETQKEDIELLEL